MTNHSKYLEVIAALVGVNGERRDVVAELLPPISRDNRNLVLVEKGEPDPVVIFKLKEYRLAFHTRIGLVQAKFIRPDVWTSKAGKEFTVGFYDLVINDFENRVQQITTYVYTYNVRDAKFYKVKEFPERTVAMR